MGSVHDSDIRRRNGRLKAEVPHFRSTSFCFLSFEMGMGFDELVKGKRVVVTAHRMVPCGGRKSHFKVAVRRCCSRERERRSGSEERNEEGSLRGVVDGGGAPVRPPAGDGTDE